jgi:UDP-glucose 4-epimerase
MTRVVITGASGFLAGHLMRSFDGPFDVIGVSRTATHPGLFRVADYADTPPGDILIHLAETNNRADVESGGDEYVQRVADTLDRLVTRGFAMIVFASSAAVYGDESAVPHPVTDRVIVRDLYTRAKLACEARVLAAGGTVARMSNLFGPGMSAENVVSAVLGQVHADGPIRVLDDMPVRDFLWVEDAAAALRRIAETGCRGTYNVGSGRGTSIRELARLALECVDQPYRDVVATRPSGRTSCNIVDISTTTRDLGWVPRVALTEGLARLVRTVPPLPA